MTRSLARRAEGEEPAAVAADGDGRRPRRHMAKDDFHKEEDERGWKRATDAATRATAVGCIVGSTSPSSCSLWPWCSRESPDPQWPSSTSSPVSAARRVRKLINAS